MSLELRPCDFQTAVQFVGEHHRHNRPPAGHKFSIACYDGDRLFIMFGIEFRAMRHKKEKLERLQRRLETE